MTTLTTPWTITQLCEQHARDLAQCSTEFERSMCAGFHTPEVRKAAELWSGSRRLTPFELAYAGACGYRGPDFVREPRAWGHA